MRIRTLLCNHTITDIFVAVFTVVDDYLKSSLETKRFTLPVSKQQKASYSEIITIAPVGEILRRSTSQYWYLEVQLHYGHLFVQLPDVTRYHRILKNLERVMADFALCLANQSDVDTTYSGSQVCDCSIVTNLASHASRTNQRFSSEADTRPQGRVGSGTRETLYAADSKPLPICKDKRRNQPRAMTEAARGFSTSGATFGFKLHAIVNQVQMFCRFAIVPANQADPTVFKALVNEARDALNQILGDKAYLGCGIYTPSKSNAKQPMPWTKLMDGARKLVESAFSSLARGQFLCHSQLNSYWSVRACVCRKIAGHNLRIWLGF
jgi:hypothetical protein